MGLAYDSPCDVRVREAKHNALRGGGEQTWGKTDAIDTHLIVAVGSASCLLLDTHARPSCDGILCINGREFASADLHAVIGYGVELCLAFSLVDGMTRAGSTSMVRGVMISVYAGMPGELVGARKTLLAAREGALERLLARMGAYMAGLETR